MGARVVVVSTLEPISLTDAYAHLRLDAYGSPAQHPDDDLISALITAAREYCEGWTGRALAPQAVEIALDSFGVNAAAQQMAGNCAHSYSPGSTNATTSAIQLPLSPIAGIVSVKYVDSNSVVQTVDPANYLLDNYQEPGWLLPVSGFTWPASLGVNSVKIRLNAGYTLPTDSPNDMPLPGSIRAAMLLTLGHLYENREATTELKLEQLPLGVAALLEPWRLRLSMA